MDRKHILSPLVFVALATLAGCTASKRHLKDTEVEATVKDVGTHINDMKADQKISFAQKALGGEHRIEGTKHFWYGSTADEQHCTFLWLTTDDKFSGGTALPDDCAKYNPKP